MKPETIDFRDVPIRAPQTIDLGEFIYVPPNSEMLAIARLYLEKCELLPEEDRSLYRKVVASFLKTRESLFLKGDQ